MHVLVVLVEKLAFVNANVHSEYVSMLMQINSVPATPSKHELPLQWSGTENRLEVLELSTRGKHSKDRSRYIFLWSPQDCNTFLRDYRLIALRQ